MARKLNVYRTLMGFYDAIVAAPNQAAALKAWGVSSNLFAENLADTVLDDAQLEAEARRKPGEIIRKPRGDQAMIAALPDRSQPRTLKPKSGASKQGGDGRRRQPAAAKPQPDRSRLNRAERDLSAAEGALSGQLRQLQADRHALDARERRIRRAREAAIVEAEEHLAREREAFDAAS